MDYCISVWIMEKPWIEKERKKYKMHKLFIENATITISHASINVKVLLHHLLDVDTREEFLCITCQYLNA